MARPRRDHDIDVAIASAGGDLALDDDSRVTFRARPPSVGCMDDDLIGLALRLRDADSFAAVAAAVIERLARVPGVTAAAVEAHDRDGPCAWFATAGFAPPPGHLGGALDPLQARARAVLRPRPDRAGTTWLCPLVGCGDVIGAVRVRVLPGTPGAGLAELLAQACTLASVRVAQLGGTDDRAAAAEALTARQYEVSVLVARGSTNAEIARLLSISPDAVKKHVSRALAALDVSNRTELAALAGRWRCAAPAAAAPALHTVMRSRGPRAAAPRTRAA